MRAVLVYFMSIWRETDVIHPRVLTAVDNIDNLVSNLQLYSERVCDKKQASASIIKIFKIYLLNNFHELRYLNTVTLPRTQAYWTQGYLRLGSFILLLVYYSLRLYFSFRLFQARSNPWINKPPVFLLVADSVTERVNAPFLRRPR